MNALCVDQLSVIVLFVFGGDHSLIDKYELHKYVCKHWSDRSRVVLLSDISNVYVQNVRSKMNKMVGNVENWKTGGLPPLY